MMSELRGLYGLDKIDSLETLQKKTDEMYRTTAVVDKVTDMTVHAGLSLIPGPASTILTDLYDLGRDSGFHLFDLPRKPADGTIHYPDDNPDVRSCLNVNQYQSLQVILINNIGMSAAEAQAVVKQAAKELKPDLSALGDKLDKIQAWQDAVKHEAKEAAERHEKAEDFKQVVEFFDQFAAIGAALGCKPLQQGAVIVSSLMRAYEGVATLIDNIHKVTQAGAEAAKSLSLGAVLGPIGIFAGALFAIFSLFSSGGPNPTEVILHQIQGLSDQLTTLHKSMGEYFKVNFNMQYQILGAIVYGFDHLKTHLRNEMGSLRIELRGSLDRIANSLKLIQRLNLLTGQEILLTDFTNIVAEADHWLAYNSLADPESGVPSVANHLSTWANLHAANRLLNGTGLYQVVHDHEQANTLLKALNAPEQINEIISYLAFHTNAMIAKKAAESSDDIIKLENYDPATLPNPRIWHLAVAKYCEFKTEFMSLDTDTDNKQIEKIIHSGDGVLRFIEQCKSKLLWQGLLEDYNKTLSDIDKAIDDLSKSLNIKWLADLNKQYAKKERDKQRKEPALKLQETVDFDYFTAKPEAIIAKFTTREINELNAIETLGHGPEVKIEGAKVTVKGLGDLLATRVRAAVKDKNIVQDSLLCAEYLNLLQFTAKQTDPLNGIHHRERVMVDATPSKPMRRIPDFYRSAQQYRISYPDGFGDDQVPYRTEVEPKHNLSDSEWSLPIDLIANMQVWDAYSKTFKLQAHKFTLIYQHEWKDMPKVLATDCWTKDGKYYDAEGKEIYRYINSNFSTMPPHEEFFTLTYKDGSIREFTNYDDIIRVFVGYELREHADDYFNGYVEAITHKFNSSDSVHYNVVASGDVDAFQNLAKDAISQHILSQRKRLALYLLGTDLPEADADTAKYRDRFSALLESLDYYGQMIKWYAYLIGKDLDATHLPILARKNVIDALQKYLVAGDLDSASVPVFSKNQMTPDAIEKLEDIKKLSAFHPKHLVLAGQSQLEFLKVSKVLFRNLFPTYSKYTNLERYQAQRAMIFSHLAHEETYQYLAYDFKRAFIEARHRTSSKFKEAMSETEYRKYWRRIHEWAILHARSDLAVGRMLHLSQTVDLSDPSNIATQLFAEMKLSRGWEANVGLLVDIAGRLINDESTTPNRIVNYAMWYEGVQAFLNLVFHRRFDIVKMAMVSVDTEKMAVVPAGSDLLALAFDEIALERLNELLDEGVKLQETFAELAFDERLFTWLFDGYLKIIDEMKGLIEKPLSQSKMSSSDLLFKSHYTGSTKKLLDKLSATALMISSYCQMLFAYDLAVETTMAIKLKLLRDGRALQTKLEEPYAESESMSARLGQCREEVESLKNIILARIRYTKSVQTFRDYLQNYNEKNPQSTVLKLHDKQLGELNRDKLYFLDIFLSQTTDEIDELSIEHISLQDGKTLEDLLDVVNKYPNIKKIRLRYANLSLENLMQINNKLSSSPDLQELDLSGNAIFGLLDSHSQLMDLLLSLPNLQKINLASTSFDECGLAMLLAVLAERPNLTTIQLADNNLGQEALMLLAEHKEHMTNVREIELSGNPISTSIEGYHLLMDIVLTLPNLQVLKLANVGLDDNGFSMLVASSVEKTDLLLDLSDNKISQTGYDEALAMLSELKAFIVLSGNALSSEVLARHPKNVMALSLKRIEPVINLLPKLLLGQPNLDMAVSALKLIIHKLKQRIDLQRKEQEIMSSYSPVIPSFAFIMLAEKSSDVVSSTDHMPSYLEG